MESGSRDGWAEDGWADGLARVLLARRPFLERLGELRIRIFRAVLALAVCSLVAWAFYGPILAFLVHPLKSLPGAGSVVSRSLTVLHWMGLISGLVFLATSMLSSLALTRSRCTARPATADTSGSADRLPRARTR